MTREPDYHNPPEGALPADALEQYADAMRQRHRLPTPDEIAAEAEQAAVKELERQARRQGGRGWGRNFAINEWAQKIAEMFRWNESRRAVSLHMSQEASRYSSSTAPMSTQQRMYHYARHRGLFGLDPLRLERASLDQLAAVIASGTPRFTPAQRRRLRHKLNHQKAGKP